MASTHQVARTAAQLHQAAQDVARVAARRSARAEGPELPRTRALEGQAAQAAEACAGYQRTFHGRTDQVSQVRRDIARHLAGCPAAEEAVLIASEMAANAVIYSASRGEFFTVRCEAYPGYVWVEVEDLGGPWQDRQPDDRPHGLDIIQALTGPDNWGAETTSGGHRVVWARLDVPREGRRT